MDEGWISLHRKIKKHWVWTDPLHFKIWVDFLMRANHEDKKILFNNELTIVKKGMFITSLKKLAKDYHCSVGKIRHILKNFEKDEMCVLFTTQKATHITISNYDSYQNKQHTESTQNENRMKPDRNQNETDNNKRITINNEGISTPGDLISELWIKTFGRNPKIPEVEETQNLLNKYGEDHLYQQMKKAALRNIKSFQYFLDNLDEKGILKDYNNGPGTNDLITYDEMLSLAPKFCSDKEREKHIAKYKVEKQPDGKFLWRKK